MSDREGDVGGASDETAAFSGPPGQPPPDATQPLSVGPPSPPPPRSRRILIGLFAALIVFGAGFVAAQLFGGKTEGGVPDRNAIFFEPASMVFPVEGAKFTRSTYDPDTKTCDKELLKRFLRADPRRFMAWLKLVGINESQFDAFVNQLETRILPAPLPVTNHGCFQEGKGACPFAIHSVLGAGTPVWYNPTTHEVVAKCLCSNPVDPPQCPPNCETPAPTPSPCPCITESPTPTRTPHETRPPQTETSTTEPPKTETPTTEPPRTETPPTEKP